jgi:RNA polymerase sigma-70 factor (ECF subfamily)
MTSGTAINRAPAINPEFPTTESFDETALCRRLQAGDGRAFEILISRYGGRMLATARRFFRAQQDAADAVQDAYLAAFKSISTFKGDSQLGTWLYRIVVNVCLMRRRSQLRRPTVAIDSLLPEFDATGHHRQPLSSINRSPSDLLATEELRQQVRDCVDQLPDPYREVLILRDIEQLDTEATAAMLGVPSGVVKTRLHRARQALRTLLEPILIQPPA